MLNSSDHNEDYSYNKDGLKIEIKHNDNSKSIVITYEPIKEHFIEKLDQIDDETFIAICEYIGKDDLKRIQNLLDVDVLKGIEEFKYYATEYLTERIDELKKLKSNIENY